MKRGALAKKILLSIYHYFCFFLIMAFVISCSMILFLTIMADSMGIVLSEENINTAAILTFWNVILLSLICTVIDGVRRKFTVERPVKRIVAAAEEIAKGNYSVRIPPINGLGRENGLDRIVDCFNSMARELSGTESMQSDFIANVSHEMKTPLAIMQNYATLLSDPELLGEDRMRYSRAISDACRRLSALIGNILRLSKLENKRTYPKVKPYLLGESICDSFISFEDIWEKKGIEIETDIDDEIYTDIDGELLSLVWNNLISNALKFTEPGGKVTLSLKAEGGLAAVKISDTGCGISPEVGRHIFDKFYQGDTSHRESGNGLGLALVKRAVDIVGAEISVDSIKGVGSTFTVKIPRLVNGTV